MLRVAETLSPIKTRGILCALTVHWQGNKNASTGLLLLPFFIPYVQ